MSKTEKKMTPQEFERASDRLMDELSVALGRASISARESGRYLEKMSDRFSDRKDAADLMPDLQGAACSVLGLWPAIMTGALAFYREALELRALLRTAKDKSEAFEKEARKECLRLQELLGQKERELIQVQRELALARNEPATEPSPITEDSEKKA